MYAETPNQDHIDPFEEQLRERYQYDKLKDWPLDRLEGERWLLENEFLMFRGSFPHEQSAIKGPFRAFIMDNPNETKMPLTSAEILRLRHIKKNAISEINRAIGHRKLERREHRHELVNSASDFVEQLSLLVLSIRATIKRILPW